MPQGHADILGWNYVTYTLITVAGILLLLFMNWVITVYFSSDVFKTAFVILLFLLLSILYGIFFFH